MVDNTILQQLTECKNELSESINANLLNCWQITTKPKKFRLIIRIFYFYK